MRARAPPSEGGGRAFKSRRDVQENGRLRWSGRHPVLKTGGHRKVRRSNRQPSATIGAGVRRIDRTVQGKCAQILKRQRGLTVNQVSLAPQVRVLLCAPKQDSGFGLWETLAFRGATLS